MPKSHHPKISGITSLVLWLEHERINKRQYVLSDSIITSLRTKGFVVGRNTRQNIEAVVEVVGVSEVYVV